MLCWDMFVHEVFSIVVFFLGRYSSHALKLAYNSRISIITRVYIFDNIIISNIDYEHKTISSYITTFFILALASPIIIAARATLTLRKYHIHTKLIDVS